MNNKTAAFRAVVIWNCIVFVPQKQKTHCFVYKGKYQYYFLNESFDSQLTNCKLKRVSISFSVSVFAGFRKNQNSAKTTFFLLYFTGLRVYNSLSKKNVQVFFQNGATITVKKY